jgi:hypothetical protein
VLRRRVLAQSLHIYIVVVHDHDDGHRVSTFRPAASREIKQ